MNVFYIDNHIQIINGSYFIHIQNMFFFHESKIRYINNIIQLFHVQKCIIWIVLLCKRKKNKQAYSMYSNKKHVNLICWNYDHYSSWHICNFPFNFSRYVETLAIAPASVMQVHNIEQLFRIQIFFNRTSKITSNSLLLINLLVSSRRPPLQQQLHAEK